ncbi:MAG: ATP-binding protein [Bacteroidales bacterium]|nr:ATP-binding protein [Bacteroidales bacterium]
MYFPKTYNRAFIYAIIFTVIVTIAAVFIFASLSKWQNILVEENQSTCELFAIKLHDSAVRDINILGQTGLLENNSLSTSEARHIDSTLKKLSEEQFKVMSGLEGGFYLFGPDEFYGYSFPTSPPPVPVYGPPPRSYNIIKNQSLKTIKQNQLIIKLHAFNAAVFPLATKPIVYNKKVVGAVWVRIHIENDLPIIKLKQVVNIAAIISITGFFILMLLSALWGGEISGIKKEMEKIMLDPEVRLRKRRGIFGYISSNINDLLDTIYKDNLQRKKLEQQLNQKEKLAALGNLIAGVAHEVKTPLSIIKTRIQMWQQEVLKNPEIAEHISLESMQMVINEINRLSDLVKRLLIFSRPIEKKMKETDINNLIKEIVSFINIERNNKHISVNLLLNEETPNIISDENSIRQVIINVLENAFEAMDSGGVINIISDHDVKNNRVVIRISDTGKGIPEEIIDKVFEPFFTSKESGVGLGLAISHQIVEAHNGEIFFSDNSDKGTDCIIKLPVSQKIN